MDPFTPPAFPGSEWVAPVLGTVVFLLAIRWPAGPATGWWRARW
jgi:hypothetical protein